MTSNIVKLLWFITIAVTLTCFIKYESLLTLYNEKVKNDLYLKYIKFERFDSSPVKYQEQCEYVLKKYEIRIQP
jgi:hypothetical protein